MAPPGYEAFHGLYSRPLYELKRLNTGTDKLQMIIYAAVLKNTVCGLHYKMTQHTKKGEPHKLCIHDNYLQHLKLTQF